jgi:L-lactate dehydrogenase
VINIQKAAVIGCGFVGASIAYTLMQKGIFSELVLIDAVMEKAEGEAMDISHGLPFAHAMDIYAGTYADIEDASILIITAGANQKEGETRLDLVQKNAGIMRSIIGNIRKTAFDGLLLIVSNPVDILTEVALRESGYPEERVIGSGTVLDTARLKYLISEELEIDSRNVHAFIVGEHGDSELAVWSCANIYGIPVEKFAELRRQKGFSEEMKEIYCSVRDSAYEIIARKHATYYGIAMAVCRICAAIVRDEQSIMPVSSLMQGEYGLEDVVLSIPAVVDANGIETVVPIELSEKELAQLKSSAEILKKIIKENS